MRFVETVMGIPMSIDIRDAGDHSDAAARAFAVLREADARFSVYRPDSEVSAANRGELGPSAFSADLAETIALGEEAERASGGAFRIHRPEGTLDLDGVVKGWAAARAAGELRAGGVRRFCLNAGGDVVVGDGPGGDGSERDREGGAGEGGAGEGVAAVDAWNVGVRTPADPAAMLAVLSVSNAAVATSGAYERGAHIVDGRTGAPATGLLSATVIADDLTTADILATAVFALGPAGIDWAVLRGARGVLALTDAGELLGAGVIDFAHPLA
ncbi:FAD:protein FMN transferase [Leifsonia sp. NPDC102414]|uniref:FAD:protein FMN transferase n=1 Tax=Leifsonia sp. NPDC102414 TaxID=3364124 RepID=UPI00382EDE63